MAVRSDAARRQTDLLLEHREFVVRLCRILLRNAEESEDAAQQVFLNAYRALSEGVTPLNVRAWLAQIARNEFRSRVRRVATHPGAPLRNTLPNGELDPADAAEQRALIARLRRELAALPERQREALVLREFRGLSYEELAAAMDETGPAVESLLQRARRRLVSRLEEARRPFVGATLVVDWIRNTVSRLSPGPVATEAAASGGAAAVVAKLAAAGVVAVGVSAAGGKVDGTRSARPVPAPDPRVASSKPSVDSRPAHRSTAAVASESRGRRRSSDLSGPGRRGVPSARPEEAESNRGPGKTSPSAPVPGPAGVTGSKSSTSGSGSGESGSGSPSSGPGEGSEPLSSIGSSEHSGSDSSGSSDSGSSGSGSSGSGSGTSEPSSSDSSGSGSSGSGSDSHSGSGSQDSTTPDH